MQSTGIRIRPGTVHDVPLIHALVCELAQYERLSHQVSATEGALRNSLFGPRPYAETLVAEADGIAAGFALYFHNYSTFLARPGIYLEDLFVRPQFRQRGAGRALLVELARIAIERGCGRLEWSVLDWNEPAIRFYRSLGAQMMDEWRINRVTGDALATLAAGGPAG